MTDPREDVFGGFELPPEGLHKYQVIDVRFEASKETKKPLMVVESECIEEGPESGKKLITYNAYQESFIVARIKSLVKRSTGKEPEDTPARPLARMLDDDGFRQVLKQLLIGKRFGARVRVETTKRGGQLPKVTGYTSLEDVDPIRAEEQAKPSQFSAQPLPTSLAGIL